MAIAHDTATRFPATDGPSGTNSVDVTTGNRTFSHAGSASTKAAVVVLCCTGTTTTVTGVLYGGVAMTLRTSANDTSEAGRVEVWVLTDGVPTGTQTVTLQGCTATGKWATCSTVTATTAVYVDAFDAIPTTITTDPQVALSTFQETMSYGGVHSGAAAPPIVPFSGFTVQFRNDYGALSASTLGATTPIAGGSVTIGYTQASDDWCMAAVAFAEATHLVSTTIAATMSAAFPGRSAVGPLSDADIVQVKSGSFATAGSFVDFPIALDAAAGYGNTVIVCTSTLVFEPSGFVRDTPLTGANNEVRIFRRSVVGLGEGSWTFGTGTGPVTVEWIALEVAGLDPTAPLDAVSGAYASATGTSVSPSLPAGTSYDVLQLVLFGARNTANTTIPTWSGYTPGGFEEIAEQGAVDGAMAVGLAVARRFPAAPTAVTTTATSSVSASLGAVMVSYAARDARVMADVGAFWGFEQGMTAGMTLGTNPIFTATTGTPAIVSTTPRTGSWCLELAATAGVCSVTQSAPFGASLIGGVRVPLRFVGGLPTGDVDLFTIEITSSATLFVRFKNATSKLEARIETSGTDGTARLSDQVVTADTWLAVEVQFDVRVTGDFLADWAVDYGDGVLVPQVQATYGGANAPASVTTLRLGWNAATATATVRMDDVVVVRDAGNYPIGDHTVQPLLVDPAGALTTTADAKFNTFNTNGGALVAWDAATAKAAVSEIPPTIGASADGIVQVTAGASDYVTLPMATSTAGIIRAARMLACGWAASGTAATLGFRAHDGTTEMLLAAAADVGFDNSTTLPVWVALPIRPAAGSYTWTQAKLDALALRVGFGDAAVAVGLHAALVEALFQTIRTDLVSGEIVTAQADPLSEGILTLEANAPATLGMDVTYEEGGTPTSFRVEAGQTHSETIDAPDMSAVNRVEVALDPEP